MKCLRWTNFFKPWKWFQLCQKSYISGRSVTLMWQYCPCPYMSVAHHETYAPMLRFSKICHLFLQFYKKITLVKRILVDKSVTTSVDHTFWLWSHTSSTLWRVSLFGYILQEVKKYTTHLKYHNNHRQYHERPRCNGEQALPNGRHHVEIAVTTVVSVVKVSGAHVLYTETLKNTWVVSDQTTVDIAFFVVSKVCAVCHVSIV